MARCWFCQLRKGTTVEHVISEAWLAREMPSVGPYVYEIIRNELGQLDAKQPFAHPRPEIQASGYCEKCNNEWMDRLDKQVEPWLSTAIRGQRKVLPRDFAATLAQWICKIAMVADTMQSEPALSQHQRDYLYEHHEPPPGWRIWLAVGDRRPRDDHRVLIVPITLAMPTGRGYFFTVALDQFLAQVLVMPRKEADTPHPLEPAVVRPLWPLPAARKLAWPDETRYVLEPELGAFASWAADHPAPESADRPPIPLFP